MNTKEHIKSKAEQCKSCGLCCQSLTFYIGRDPEATKFYTTRGLKLFEKLGYVSVPHICQQYDQENKVCKIYDDRPDSCKKFQGFLDPFIASKCVWSRL